MADEPKPETAPQAQPGSNAQPEGTNVSPAPTEVAGKPAGAVPDPAAAAGAPQAEALPDGTTPTVLKPGAVHKSVAKGKASLTPVYRRADILTTLLTFAGAVDGGK